MNQKPIDYRTKVTLLGALLGLLSLTAILGWTFSQQVVTNRQSSEPLFAGFQPNSVTGMVLGNGVTLTKTDTWNLLFQEKSFPAASTRIEAYLTTLGSLKRERLVTRSGEAKAFGLDQGFQTVQLLGPGNQILADLQVGAVNDQGTKVAVRLAGQSEIWETDAGFSRSLQLDFNTWADLSLFPGKKAADLTRITFDSRIETADKTVFSPFDLVRTTKDGKSVWEDRLTKVATEPLASWADSVTGFRFGAFALPEQASNPGTLGTLTFYWSDGSTSMVKIGAPDGQNRYRATDGTRDFWINDWALGQLLYR